MTYGYGPAPSWPYFGPSWSPGAWGGFPGYGGTPWFGGGYWGPGFGYGTFPFGPAPIYPALARPAPNDEEIKYFVENAIDSDPEIPPHADITVDVRNGVVTLTGTVPNKRIKHAAGDDAWWVPPVTDVHNEIQVVPRRERAAVAEGGAPPAGRRTSPGGR